MKNQKAQLNYLTIAPRKVRLVANALKGMSAVEAQAQLILRPQRAAKALLKLLNSAIAGAKSNQQLMIETLKIGSIRVDGAPVLKRSLPRAQGRATSIFKRMSHVTLELVEVVGQKNARFVIALPEKKKKAPSDGKKPKPTRLANKEEQGKDLEHSKPEKQTHDSKDQMREASEKGRGGKGFVKKMFSRKTV